MGILSGLKNDEIAKQNAANLYEKMAKYLLEKEKPSNNEFENAAFAIIYRVILLDGTWNGPFIPKEIEETYNNFYGTQSVSIDNTADACAKTADYYATNKGIKKPKNGRIPRVC